MENPQYWYFTWGSNHEHADCYTTYYGTQDSTRDVMIRHHGHRWGFQYPSRDAAGIDRHNLKYLQ